MSHLWRLVSVLLALLAGVALPLLGVLVVDGVIDTGPAGALALVVLVVLAVAAAKLVARRLQGRSADA